MKLEMKTLTPLWTGGAEAGKVDRLHESGVIGSLRWWMETFVRGLGGQVQDPTQNERSSFDHKKDHKEDDESSIADKRALLRDAGLCDVSQIFGATGWRRRFRLVVQDGTKTDNAVSREIKAQRSYMDKDGRTRTPIWYFQNKPRSGKVVFQIQSLVPDFQAEVIGGLIQFVADWAAIGARAQMGFGVIGPVDGRVETRTLYDWLSATIGIRSYPNLPSLKNIFLARIKSKDMKQPFTEISTFNLKYDLRRLFAGDEKVRHFIMGTVKDGRIAAKIKVSRPYSDGLIRVWGWTPERATAYAGNWSRSTVVDQIYQHLNTNYTLEVWREMDSTRDNVAPSGKDAQRFLGSLLGLREDGDAA